MRWVFNLFLGLNSTKSVRLHFFVVCITFGFGFGLNANFNVFIGIEVCPVPVPAPVCIYVCVCVCFMYVLKPIPSAHKETFRNSIVYANGAYYHHLNAQLSVIFIVDSLHFSEFSQYSYRNKYSQFNTWTLYYMWICSTHTNGEKPNRFASISKCLVLFAGAHSRIQLEKYRVCLWCFVSS